MALLSEGGRLRHQPTHRRRVEAISVLVHHLEALHQPGHRLLVAAQRLLALQRRQTLAEPALRFGQIGVKLLRLQGVHQAQSAEGAVVLQLLNALLKLIGEPANLFRVVVARLDHIVALAHQGTEMGLPRLQLRFEHLQALEEALGVGQRRTAVVLRHRLLSLPDPLQLVLEVALKLKESQRLLEQLPPLGHRLVD